MICLPRPRPWWAGFDRDVDDLEGGAAVADDAAHADHGVAVADDDSKPAIGQARFGGFLGFAAEAGGFAQAAIVGNAGCFRDEDIIGHG